MKRHIPRRRWSTGEYEGRRFLIRVAVDPRQVLVPGTRRAVPFHPLSMAARSYLRHGRTDTPRVVLNARRRARKATNR